MNAILDDIRKQLNDYPDEDVTLSPEDAEILLNSIHSILNERDPVITPAQSPNLGDD